jgi:mono/diheme cytochrome c family protein
MKRSALLVLAVFALVGCGVDKTENRGLRYMPDMYVSPALKSQEAWVVVATDADGNEVVRHVPAMLTPPTGTIPRDFMPYDLGAEQLEAADRRANPLPPDATTLRLGRDKYDQFCAVCHGRSGDATAGYVKDQFKGIPSLNTTIVASYSDGRIYHWITLGRGRMPPYGAQLLPEERWAVIHYVRSLESATERQGDSTLSAGEAFQPLPDPVPEYQQAQNQEVMP